MRMAGGREKQRGWLHLIMPGRAVLPVHEAKKDDDRWKASSRSQQPWIGFTNLFKHRRRRILVLAIAIYIVYWVFTRSNINFTVDLRNPKPNPTYRLDESVPEPKRPPPGLKMSKGAGPPREYDGPLAFYRLPDSLRKAAYQTNGFYHVNRNVLFAASSLESVSTIIPLACEMAIWNRNHVHIAFTGREDIPSNKLLEINGWNNATACPAMFHDARPDYPEYSTDSRAERSVSAAMEYFRSYLHPQVAIIDGSESEDAFFLKGIRFQAKRKGIPVIEIPEGRAEDYGWITRLDAGSLRSWHKPTVDIVIQASSTSSGGLLRLLKSLREADYGAMRPPRLTINLPAEVDPTVTEYLNDFHWPPHSGDNPLKTNELIIRRRVSRKPLTAVEASVRLFELFYPVNNEDSHVLVLAHNAEVSPLYFQYLHYAMLEYKYADLAGVENDSRHLLGLSLERPDLLADGRPRIPQLDSSHMGAERFAKLFPRDTNIPFLSQTPDSHAILFFGDKWAEMRSFMSNRLEQRIVDTPSSPLEMTVGETSPAWTRYVHELMLARGYSVLYPAFQGAQSLVTLHHEVYRTPEELAPGTETKQPIEGTDGPSQQQKTTSLKLNTAETPLLTLSRPLHIALPFDGDLPELSHLPYFLTDGSRVRHKKIAGLADKYAQHFRSTVGQCGVRVPPKGARWRVRAGSADDLFCFGEGEDGFELEKEEESGEISFEY